LEDGDYFSGNTNEIKGMKKFPLRKFLDYFLFK